MTPACVTATVRPPSPDWASSQPRDPLEQREQRLAAVRRRGRVLDPRRDGNRVLLVELGQRAPAPRAEVALVELRRRSPRRGRAPRRSGARGPPGWSTPRRNDPGAGRARGPRRARARRAARRGGTPNGAWHRTERGGRASGVSWKSQFADSLVSEPRNVPTRSIGWPPSARWCEEAGVKPARSRHCDRSVGSGSQETRRREHRWRGRVIPRRSRMPDAVHAPSQLTERALPAGDQPPRDLAVRAARRRARWCSCTSSAPTKARRPWCRATTCTSSCTTAATCSASPATEPGVTT